MLSQLVASLPADERDDMSPTTMAEATSFAASFAEGYGNVQLVLPTVDTGEGRVGTTTTTTATQQQPVILRNIPYVAGTREAKQHLDVYLPANPAGAPLILHIHGGGWQRGDRATKFYGAPAMSAGYAAMGFVAVAPSYRLGNDETILADLTTAIAFTLNHLPSLDPRLGHVDLSRVYLSGHSAGGHMAALLLSDTARLDAVGVPHAIFKGAFLVSGIYTLRNPFGEKFGYWKNGLFQQAYVERTFRPHNFDLCSPTYRIVQAVGDATERSALSLRTHKPPRRWFGSTSSSGQGSTQTPAEDEGPTAAAVHRIQLLQIPVLVLSASSDLGLEYDASYLCSMLQKYGSPMSRHVTIPNTWHRSICEAPATFREIEQALHSWLGVRT